MNCKLGIAIVLTLALIATLQLGLNSYSIQETVLVLLVVGTGVIVVFLFLVAFVLFREGVRLGFLWLKAGLRGLRALSGRNLGPRDAMDHPRPLK